MLLPAMTIARAIVRTETISSLRCARCGARTVEDVNALLRLDVRAFDHLPPLLYFPLNERVQSLGRSAGNVYPRSGQRLPDLRQLDEGIQFAVELRDRGARCPR